MKKYLFKEIAPETVDTNSYFDTDSFNENSGDYCNTLFIIVPDRFRSYCAINDNEYKRIETEINQLQEAIHNFSDFDVITIAEAVNNEK